MSLDEWDARYRGAAEVGAPTALVTATARALPPGRALDLACGSGRHALWLAEQGWDVTAVDGSPAAISLLLREADKRQLAVDARVADLEKGEFRIEPAVHDLILCCYYLQRNLLAKIKEGVASGGVAIVITLMSNSIHGTQPGELRACFEGWEILHDHEGPDGASHVVAEIAARKPSSA